MSQKSNGIIDILGRSLSDDDTSSEKFDALFLLENLPHIVFKLDAKYRWLFLNPSWERATGFQRTECLGSVFHEYLHPEDRQQLSDYFAHLQPGRRNSEAVDARLITRHSDPCWTEIYAVQIIDSLGQSVFVGTMIDISTRIAEEEVLHANHRSLSGILNDLSGMVYRCRNDKDWTMEYLSGGCKDLTGYHPSDMINNSKFSWDSLIHPEDHKKVWAEVQSGVRDSRYYDFNYRFLTIDKKIKWVWERGKGIFSDDGELLGLEGFITDITESKLSQNRLSENQLYNPINGLPNIPIFLDRLSRAIQASKIRKEFKFSLLMVHFQRLAEALERYGIGFEKIVIKKITDELLKSVSPLDSLVQLKTDRYAILIENDARYESITLLAQEILDIMRTPIQHHGHTHFLTCSIGASSCNHNCDNAEAVMNAAMVAVDYAAAQGGSRFERFDPEFVDY